MPPARWRAGMQKAEGLSAICDRGWIGSDQSPQGRPHRPAKRRRRSNRNQQQARTPWQSTMALIAGFLPQSTPTP